MIGVVAPIRGDFHTRNSRVRVKAIEFARFGSLICIAFACGFAIPALAQGLPIDWGRPVAGEIFEIHNAVQASQDGLN